MPERIETIAGSMFAGKTEELIRRIGRVEIAEMQIQVFKPSIDNRWGTSNIIRSHSGLEYPATPVDHPSQIWEQVDPRTNVVAIEEAQFFDPEIVRVVDALIHRNVRVIIAGLRADFRNEPFGAMDKLLAKSDHVLTLTAICKHRTGDCPCRAEATRTQRLVNGRPANYDDPIIMVGAENLYEARCAEHHEVLNPPKHYQFS